MLKTTLSYWVIQIKNYSVFPSVSYIINHSGHYQLNQELNTGIPRITGNTDSIIYYHNMSGYNYSNKQTSTISTQTPQYLDTWFIVQMLGDDAGIKLFMIMITLLMSLMFWYLRKEVSQNLVKFCFICFCNNHVLFQDERFKE
jgi:hypothetical protein